MYSILMENLSVLITFGTLANSFALVRILDSERVRLVLICLSRAGWR